MMHVAEGRLLAYIDGELPTAERSALESHLATCDACGVELDELRRIAAELHTALVGTDMVAGIAPALQAFSERRAALVGAPAAATDLDAHRARRTGATSQFRFARSSLLKAAALAALVVGAASAAIPDSPFRDWLENAWDRVTGAPAETETAQPAAPVPPVQAPEPLQAPGEPYRFAPSNGGARVLLRGIDPAALVRVRLIDGARAAVYPPPQAAVQTTVRAGELEVLAARGTAGGTYIVEIPRSVERATVEVNGRVLFRKNGDALFTDGAVPDGGEDEYLLHLRS